MNYEHLPGLKEISPINVFLMNFMGSYFDCVCVFAISIFNYVI